MPILGPAANKYLWFHGYTPSAIQQISFVVQSYEDEHDFIDFLQPQGMPYTKLKYLWDLIQDIN